MDAFKAQAHHAVQDPIPEAGVSAPLPPIDDNSSAHIGLLGEDLQLKGKHVGQNLCALFAQSLYEEKDLRAPAKCSSVLLKPFVLMVVLTCCPAQPHVTYAVSASVRLLSNCVKKNVNL